MKAMNRRQAFLLWHRAVPCGNPREAKFQGPLQVSMSRAGRMGEIWQAGILVELEPDWKTYWRVPGDSGIPPQFDWAGSKK
jgi:DsbC/DsbD-like thiol-disulfide interchange protein